MSKQRKSSLRSPGQVPKAPETHSILSASSCERWWHCPGSALATSKLPRTSTKYTVEGTVAHGLASEALLKEWTPVELDDHIGEVIECEGYDVEVTEEMVDAIQVYVDFVRQQFAPGHSVIIEDKVHLEEVHDTLFGTPDAVVIHPYKTVYINDYKHGSGKRVNAWENKQLMYYALGYAQEDVERVIINIIQPRYGDGEDPVSTFEITPESLAMFAAELKVRANEALRPNAPRRAGDWCHSTFCPLMAECPAVEARAREVVAADFGAPPAVETMSVTQIRNILDYSDFISKWLSKVKDQAKERMIKGERIPGYKLVESLGNRKWSSEEAVESDFADKYGEDIYAPRKLKSPSQMEKIVGKKGVEPYTHRPPNGHKLVPETARGEAIRISSPGEDFAE